MELEIERILGLPAHPLFAHAPVVLLPLATVGALASVLSARWRARLGWVVVAVAVVGVVSAQLAIGSGEALEDAVRENPLVDDHAGVSDTLLPVAAAFAVSVGGLVGVDAVRRRRSGASGASGADDPDCGDDGAGRLRVAAAALVVATVVTGVATDVWVYRAGHSGARAVWDDPDRPRLTR